MFSDGGSSTSEKSQKQGTATHLGGRPSASGGGNVTSTGGASSGFGLKGDLPDAGRQKPSPPEPTPYTPAASKASGSLGVTQSQQRSYDIDSDDSSDDKSPQRPVAPGPPGPAPYPPRPSIRHQPLVSGRDDSSDDDSLDDRSPSLPPASIAPLSGKDSLARQHPQTTSETSRFDHGADSPSDVSSSWGGGGGGARGREGSGSGGQIAGGGGLRPSAPDPRSAMRRPAPTAVYRDDYPRDDGAGSDYSQDEYSDEILGRSSGGGVGRSGGGRAPPLPHGDNMDGPKVSRMAGPTGGKGPSVPPPLLGVHLVPWGHMMTTTAMKIMEMEATHTARKGAGLHGKVRFRAELVAGQAGTKGSLGWVLVGRQVQATQEAFLRLVLDQQEATLCAVASRWQWLKQ